MSAQRHYSLALLVGIAISLLVASRAPSPWLPLLLGASLLGCLLARRRWPSFSATVGLWVISLLAVLLVAQSVPDWEVPSPSGNVLGPYASLLGACLFWVACGWGAIRFGKSLASGGEKLGKEA